MDGPDAPHAPEDRYAVMLARILRLPSLADESANASLFVRCVFTPSFHPEVVLSLVERQETAELTVRVALRSVRAFMSAREGIWPGAPLDAFVEPAVSIERVELERRPALAERFHIDEVLATAYTPRTVLGLDGMGIDLVVWRGGPTLASTLWSGAFDATDPRCRLVTSCLDGALHGATWRRSREGLRHARGYLPP